MTQNRASEPSQRLFLSRDDRVIAGVCGGLGDYFELDSVIIRTIFVLLGLGGIGVVIYLTLWIITPEAPTTAEPSKAADNTSERAKDEVRRTIESLRSSCQLCCGRGRRWLGGGLVFLGVFFLLQQFEVFHWLTLGQLWPVVLIVIGFLVLKGSLRR